MSEGTLLTRNGRNSLKGDSGMEEFLIIAAAILKLLALYVTRGKKK